MDLKFNQTVTLTALTVDRYGHTVPPALGDSYTWVVGDHDNLIEWYTNDDGTLTVISNDKVGAVSISVTVRTATDEIRTGNMVLVVVHPDERRIQIVPGDVTDVVRETVVTVTSEVHTQASAHDATVAAGTESGKIDIGEDLIEQMRNTAYAKDIAAAVQQGNKEG